MERGRLLSLKRKISDGKLRNVAEEVVSIDEPLPDELIASIRDSLEAGTILDSWSLGKLVIRTRDREIFHAPSAHAMIFSSSDVLCDLLRAGIPDKEIEETLCRELASDFDENRGLRREFILEALRDCGTVSSLDVLEAIEFDFSARLKVAETVLPGISGLQPALTQGFVQNLKWKRTYFWAGY